MPTIGTRRTNAKGPMTDSRNAGLVLAQETLNGPAQNFLNNVNILLASEDIDLSTSEGRKVYTTLQGLRYNWVQMMSNLRYQIQPE